MSEQEHIHHQSEKPSIKNELIYVTPEQASTWLKECKYDKQRKVEPPFVDNLIGALKQGQWRPRLIEFGRLPDKSFARGENGPVQLINGQHGLTAIQDAKIGAWNSISWEDFPSQHAIDEAYARIDAGRARGMVDALKAFGIGAEELERRGDIGKLAAAVMLLQTQFKGFGGIPQSQRGKLLLHNRDTKARLCEEWLPEMMKFNTLTDKPLPRLSAVFRLAGVMAVGLITLRYQPEKAATFWDDIAHFEKLTHGEPAQRMRELTVGGVNEKGEPEAAKSGEGGPYVSRYAAACWNAFCRGRKEVSIPRPGRKSTTSVITIMGTPYTKYGTPTIDKLPTAEEWSKNPKRSLPEKEES